ncbi:MAG: hypothetical protein IT329_14165 [Caldilineaceae bacterium]|nr:hypothetical protein [Caldilineaceae bacterium]
MAKPNRLWALLAYLLPLVGPLLVIGVQRRSAFSLYHACQSLALLLGVVVIPGLWAVLGWLVAWAPLAGPVVAMASFSLVVAGLIMAVVAWLLGIVAVLRGRMDPLPLFGAWGERLWKWFTPAARATTLMETAQPASHS